MVLITFLRAIKYLFVRILTLFLVIVVSIYLTILVASKGGIIESELQGSQFNQGWFSGLLNVRASPSSADETGLPQSVFMRNLLLIKNSMTFQWSQKAGFYYSGANATLDNVQEIVLDSLPRTLMVFGTANILVFFTSLLTAAAISRNYGSWLDRLLTALSPISSIPTWIIGLILVILMAEVFHIYRGGILHSWPDQFSWEFFWILLKWIAPAIVALFINRFFQTVYIWRTYFLTYYGEDYVELAKAKGLRPEVIQRRYIMRPLLPSIITSFTTLMIGIWQEAIVIEVFFGISGIGMIFYQALKYNSAPVIVALVVMFAYLLAFSVLLLDVIYVIVDPRIRIGSEKQAWKAVSKGKPGKAHFWQHKRAYYRPQQPVIAPINRSSHHEKNIKESIFRISKAISGIFKEIQDPLQEIIKYPSALAGLSIIAILIVISIYGLATVPVKEAIRLWNNDQNTWLRNPQNARPVWINWFRANKLPETIIIDSRDGSVEKSYKAINEKSTEINIPFVFQYQSKDFPQDLSIEFYPKYVEKAPYIALSWITPDGRVIQLEDQILRNNTKYYLNADLKLKSQIGDQFPIKGLFTAPDVKEQAIPGTYKLIGKGIVFEQGSDIDAEFKLDGQVYGIAGTDKQRRDLSIALLSGAPIILIFGLLGALGTSLTTMSIAAIGAWFGSLWDGLIQRLTELNMLIPSLGIFLMVYLNYSKSIWIILGVAILLNIFGSGIKTYRAIFLQVKEAPYIEAARSYGASNLRIIFHYLVPRVLPVFIPQLVILIPSYIFLEATLAFLNITDPLLPTWGKVIMEAVANNAINNAPYWILEPVGLLLITAFAFLMIGFTLERVLNPRLRDT